MTMLTEAEIAELERLEESLWRAETRFDLDYMQRVLAPDFCEFGRSGRVYRREDTLAVAAIPFEARFPLPEFTARLIAPDVALVTYRSEVAFGDLIEHGNRSSLWSRDGGGWTIRFHQGTALPVQD